MLVLFGFMICVFNRLIELENQLVYNLTDSEVATCIKASRDRGGALHVLVLREIPAESNDLRDDLDLVMMDLETAHHEIKDLNNDKER